METVVLEDRKACVARLVVPGGYLHNIKDIIID
jgi:hypothetical protein